MDWYATRHIRIQDYSAYPLLDLFTAAGLLDIWHSRVYIAASLDLVKQFYANHEIMHKGVDRILTSWVQGTVIEVSRELLLELFHIPFSGTHLS